MEQLKSLLSELKILNYIGHHVSIVNLLGACTVNLSKGELYVIVEYCHHGSLQTFLQKNRDKFVEEPNATMKSNGKVDCGRKIAMDIFDLIEIKNKINDSSPSGQPEVINPLSKPFNAILDSNHKQKGKTALLSQTVECQTVTIFFCLEAEQFKTRLANLLSNKNGSKNQPDRMEGNGEASNAIPLEIVNNSLLNNESSAPPYMNISTVDEAFCLKDLVYFAYQCSKGMEYLSSRKVSSTK